MAARSLRNLRFSVNSRKSVGSNPLAGSNEACQYIQRIASYIYMDDNHGKER